MFMQDNYHFCITQQSASSSMPNQIVQNHFERIMIQMNNKPNKQLFLFNILTFFFTLIPQIYDNPLYFFVIIVFMKNTAVVVCLSLLATIYTQSVFKESQNDPTETSFIDPVNYPVRLTYVNRLTQWWPPSAIAQGLAVPGFTSTSLPFNYIALAFWTYEKGPLDAALVWSNPLKYFGPDAFGKTKEEIQATLKAKYTAANVKLIVSAFGATENPTSSGFDPVDCGKKLAQFVADNKFDGVDVDWEDTHAFQKGDGRGEEWLITLTKTLRQHLPPNAIITHAPPAPYFTTANHYPGGGYRTVHKEVGNIIQFYNIQYYNQGATMYNNAQNLFNVSGGWAPETSVSELIANHIEANKIVVGKPATENDATNSYMKPQDIDAAIVQNFPCNGWKTGIMFWQFSSDKDGKICSTASRSLMRLASEERQAEQVVEY